MKQLYCKFFLNAFVLVGSLPLLGAAPCPPCPATGPRAEFCNLTITQQFCVSGNSQLAGDLTVCGTIINNAIGFGNTVRVDQVYGSVDGQRNGAPFLTINQALAVAQPGDVVWIFPGVYNESITIPTGVKVRGLATDAVTIQRLAVVAATDLITMGENTSLENVNLMLTSSAHVQLRGVVFPGTTTETAKLINVSLLVDNSGAGAGSSNVYGVHSTGTGLADFEFATIRSSAIRVNSTGTGAKRGILLSSASGLNANDVDIIAEGGSNAIGVETNNAGALFAVSASNIAGDTADISQTLGTLSVTSTSLENSEANGLGFDTAIAPGSFVFVDPTTLPAPTVGDVFMGPGTVISSGTELFIPISQELLVKAMAVYAVTEPGFGETTTFTLRRNGADTGFTVSLIGTQNFNVNNALSQHFDQGDQLSLRVDNSAFSSTANVSVLLDVY